MTQEWPGDWISGAQKKAEQLNKTIESESGVDFANDDGTLYLVGDEAGQFVSVDLDESPDVYDHLWR